MQGGNVRTRINVDSHLTISCDEFIGTGINYRSVEIKVITNFLV